MTTPLVFLVPGFFGFTSVGAVSYFEDVEQALDRALRRRGVKARIVRCRTQPTASITRRADALRRQVLRKGGLEARELHFVGHSAGGLDVRMLLTPGVKVGPGETEERIARRTRTAITVTTPHHGTPLANHFISVHGQTLLLVLSALATSGEGRGTILAAAKAIALVARLDDWLGRKDTPLDRIAEGLLRKIRFDRKDPVWKYLGDVERDQGAVLQLTPEGIDMFAAAVSDRAGIDYSCVVAGVPKPREEFNLKALVDPEFLALRAVVQASARAHRPTAPALSLSETGQGGAAAARSRPRLQGDPGHQRRHRADVEPGARPAAPCRAGRSSRRGRALHAGERADGGLAALGRRLHARSIRGHLGCGRRRDRQTSPASASPGEGLTLTGPASNPKRARIASNLMSPCVAFRSPS